VQRHNCDNRGNSQIHEDEPAEFERIGNQLGASAENDRFRPVDEETWHAGSQKEGDHREVRGKTGSVVVDTLMGLLGTSTLYTRQPSQNTFPSMWVQKTAETPKFILTNSGSTPRSLTPFSVYP
jgi:hypothetical protein